MIERVFQSIFKKNSPITQAVMDEHRAAVLLKIWDRHNSNPNFKYTDAEDTLVHQESIDMSDMDRRTYIANSLNDKMLKMFKSIHNSFENKELNHLSSQLYAKPPKFNSQLKESVGFELEVVDSAILNAGKGVVIRTHDKKPIVPGTLVALYPGQIYLREFIRNQNDLDALLPDEHYMLMFRTDGIVIDGRTTNAVPFNPFALAHYFNHVPAGKHPNMVPILYDFPSGTLLTNGFSEELRQYVPNTYAKPPTIFGTIDRSAFMYTIAFLAGNYLQDGEELVFDYRLNPRSTKNPSWYNSYDPISARRRWATPEQLRYIDTEEEEENSPPVKPMILRSNHAKTKDDNS